MFRLAALSLIAALLTASSSGLAQGKKNKADPTRSVQGVVSAPDDSIVKGAIVQLKDTKTLQIRSFITKTDGLYHFHGLNPNVDYELRAEYQGASSSTKTLSSFDTKKPVVNLKLDSKR